MFYLKLLGFVARGFQDFQPTVFLEGEPLFDYYKTSLEFLMVQFTWQALTCMLNEYMIAALHCHMWILFFLLAPILPFFYVCPST